MIGLRQFKVLNLVNQKKIIEQISYKYINELKNLKQISKELQIYEATIRSIIKNYNIKRTKEQIVLARKKYNLDNYGDENYCNVQKVKKSLEKSKSNLSKISKENQIKRSKKLLQDSGLMSFNLLNNNEKRKYIDDILLCYDEYLTNDEICKKLKITISCYGSLCKFGKIKRTSAQHQKMCENSNLKKFGVKNVYQLQTVKDKIKNQNLEKYGVEYNWQRDDVKKKCKQIKLERYGNENYRNDEKIKQTCIERYGATSPFASDIIKEKRRQNNLLKFDSISPFGNKRIFNKGQLTKIRKYGTAHYVNIKKMKQTLLNRYGNENYNNLEQISKTCQERYNVKWSCQLPQCVNKSNSVSKINQNFANILSNNNIQYEQEYPLDDKKYDFKIGNTLVEINPTYTHNSTIGCGFNGHYENKLPKDYHLNKSLLAQENGYFCIHVFDWDDWNKIINRFLPKQKIYARQCELKEIKNKKELDNFLNLYHLQNTCRAQKIKLGLYYDNKLIEVMTFGKPRYNKNYEWELLRLCTHKDYNVVGGSERLFKYFINKYNPNNNNIISYCDYSKFSGEVYERLGMEFKELTNPNCNWSKGKQKITNNLLMQRGADQLIGTNDGKGTSNKDIMIRENWKEIYDCGQKVFIWHK